MFCQSLNLSASTDFFVTHQTYLHWVEEHENENTCKITGKTNSCWLDKLNASMGNIKYTCNVMVKLSTNSRPVKIYSMCQNDFLV